MRKPFYAKFDPDATWLDHLKPAFGKDKFFFETGDDVDSHTPAAAPRKVIPISSAARAGAAHGKLL